MFCDVCVTSPNTGTTKKHLWPLDLAGDQKMSSAVSHSWKSHNEVLYAVYFHKLMKHTVDEQ